VRPTLADARWSVSLSVSPLDTAVSSAETDERIEILFGMRIWVDPKNVLFYFVSSINMHLCLLYLISPACKWLASFAADV